MLLSQYIFGKTETEQVGKRLSGRVNTLSGQVIRQSGRGKTLSGRVTRLSGSRKNESGRQETLSGRPNPLSDFKKTAIREGCQVIREG